MAAIVQHNGQTELLDMTREDVEVHKDVECKVNKLLTLGRVLSGRTVSSATGFG